MKHLVNLLGEFEALGVAFVSVRDAFDVTTASGKAMLGMCMVFAEFERSLIQSRVQSAMDAIKAGTKRTRSGKAVGRPSLAIDLADLQARRARGESMRAIGRGLSISASVLAKRLATGSRDSPLAAIEKASPVPTAQP
jgi:DNA invertase Pin-like site-specific DNA recombinase